MIDLATFKQILTKNGLVNLTEEDVIKLRDQQDQMAEVFFAMWAKEAQKK